MPKKRVSLNRALTCVIIAQCFGLTAGAVFGNGFMTTWLKELGLSRSFILMLMSLPSAIFLLSGIPAAFWADSRGKKFVGNIGSITAGLSLGIFALPAFFESISPTLTSIVGIVMFSFGGALFGSSWFGLISPIIPKTYRGRFFSRLRISWQAVNISLSFIIASMLALYPGRKTFGVTLLVIMVLVLLRSWAYSYIPERPDVGRDKREGFVSSALNLLKCTVYRRYLFYLFTVTILTSSFISLTTLLEKEVLGFANNTVVMMGNMMLIGTVVGFYIGGQVVDKISTYKMFFWGHILNATAILVIPFHLIFGYDRIIIGSVLFLYGMVSAAVGIASSSQLFAVMPSTQRSLGTTMSGVFSSVGALLAGLTVSGITAFVDLYPAKFGNVKISIYHIILVALGTLLFCALPALKLLKNEKKV